MTELAASAAPVLLVFPQRSLLGREAEVVEGLAAYLTVDHLRGDDGGKINSGETRIRQEVHFEALAGEPLTSCRPLLAHNRQTG